MKKKDLFNSMILERNHLVYNLVKSFWNRNNCISYFCFTKFIVLF